MVFYVPPKRLRRHRGKEEKASITDLPDELLLQVQQYLDTQSVLNMRLCRSFMVPTCNTSIQERLKVLYIHPSTNALRTAIDICLHPIFGQEINEVVLLGRSMWQDIEKVYPGYREGGTEHKTYTDTSGWNTRFKPWPPNLHSVSKGCNVTAECDVSDDISAKGHNATERNRGALERFERAYKPLIDALTSLPKLNTLSFAEEPRLPGFNRISEKTIATHARKSAAQHGRGCSLCGDRMEHLADADVFLGLLLDQRLRFTALRQESELPFTELAKWELYLPTPPLVLTDLDVVINCGWPFNHAQDWYRWLIWHSHATLRSLRLTFLHNTTQKKAEMEHIVRNLFCNGRLSFPKLEVVDLELKDLSPARHHCRPQRPTCQYLDIASFLEKHLQTLSHIRFENILFAYYDGPFQQSAPETTRGVLELLKTSTTLKDIQWTVNRYEHDRRCKRKDDEPLLGCTKFECGNYNNAALQSSMLQDFETLAADLGVELDGGKQMWDFGEVVMRSIENCSQSGEGLIEA